MGKKRIMRLSSSVEREEGPYLAGRDEEIRIFGEKLTAGDAAGCLLNIYGTGGVGKSYLIDYFRSLASKVNVPFILLDCRVLSDKARDFCQQLLRLLGDAAVSTESDASIGTLKERSLNAIGQLAEKHGRMVLALDTFEEAGELEHWLREEFLSLLDLTQIVIAGRVPLQGTWLLSPIWRRRLLRMRVSDLAYEDAKQVLRRTGIESEEMIRRIWQRTRGHPLTLSLLAATTLVQTLPGAPVGEEDDHILTYVVDTWLREVPETEMREIIEAAAVLRLFNQETISYILEKEIGTELFVRLTSLSFVQRTERGWLLHDLLRNAIRDQLRMRLPTYFDKLWRKSAMYYYHKIRLSAHNRSQAWENAEWLYYFGDQLIQSIFYRQTVEYELEPLSPDNWAEAEAYIAGRWDSLKELRIPYWDAQLNQTIEYVCSPEESAYGLKHIHLLELYNLDADTVKLVRDRSGCIRGMLVVIPIHELTLDYLKESPLSRSYFSNLPESSLHKLKVPKENKAGYFFKTIDVSDYSDPVLLQLAGLVFIRHMLTVEYNVAAPPPYPFAQAVMHGLGFEIVKGAEHLDYDENQPAPVFVMDRREEKLHHFMKRMLLSLGIREEDDEVAHAGVRLLTSKEKIVAELTARGYSNHEVASALYLSETTVKKHLSHVYRKLGVKNRTGLASILFQMKE